MSLCYRLEQSVQSYDGFRYGVSYVDGFTVNKSPALSDDNGYNIASCGLIESFRFSASSASAKMAADCQRHSYERPLLTAPPKGEEVAPEYTETKTEPTPRQSFSLDAVSRSQEPGARSREPGPRR